MLPVELKRSGTLYGNNEVWQSYLNSIGDFASSIDHDFLSSICLEHFDRFNSCFPKFDVHKHKIERISLTAKMIYRNVRYGDNKKLDFWYFQVDECLSGSSNLSYPQLQYCMEYKKWSFCPVIIEHDFGIALGGDRLGRPFHLIEGTHRVSFINRLFELDVVSGDSLHELLAIRQ